MTVSWFLNVGYKESYIFYLLSFYMTVSWFLNIDSLPIRHNKRCFNCITNKQLDRINDFQTPILKILKGSTRKLYMIRVMYRRNLRNRDSIKNQYLLDLTNPYSIIKKQSCKKMKILFVILWICIIKGN